MGFFPFADVQVGPNCVFGRRITVVAVEYGPADVTVSLVAALMKTTTRSPALCAGSVEKGENENDWNEVHVGDAGGFR